MRNRALSSVRSALPTLLVGLAALAWAPSAGAQEESSGPVWEKQIRIESDLRFRLEDQSIGNQFAQRTLVQGVERNQNLLSTKLSVSWENLRAVAQADLVLFGYRDQITSIEGLSDAEQLQPYRIDINELYVQVKDLLVKGLDVRLGQQIVQWGVADQFNPTNNLNADDILDPVQFGRQQGNFMARADFWVSDDFSIQGVLVPLFKAARLPPSAQLGLYAIDRLPWQEEKLRYRIGTERNAALTLANTPTAVDKITIDQPETSFENMQAGFRIAGTVVGQDWSLSYYNGRTDFPVAVKNHTRQSADPICNEETKECSNGALLTDVTLAYPKMHVYGLNLAGEIPTTKDAGGIGYRLEGALVVPREQKIELTNDEINLAGFKIPKGEYDYDGDGRPGGPSQPTVVDNQPYLKWTLGFDYSFAGGVLLNAMWVHGFADEYGAGDWMFGKPVVRESSTLGGTPEIVGCAIAQDGTKCAHEITRPAQGDYVVLGGDVKFLDDQALVRVFAIFEVNGYTESTVENEKRVEKSLPFYTPEGFSASIFPEFDYNFGNGLELGLGALFAIGKPYTKFGDPAAGGSMTYVRARYAL